jgi:hypothetical protein
MRKRIFFSLLVVCVMAILAAGCTTSENTDTAVTPTPQIVYVTVMVTPTPTPTHCYFNPYTSTCQDTPVTAKPGETAISTTTTTVTTDPILHRWIRQDLDGTTGYEFKFYSDGSVVYNYGNIKTTSGNIAIPSPILMGSGTWTKLSEGQYLIKILPVGVSGAPIVRQYNIVPVSGTLPVHLVSDYEQADVDNATKSGTIHSYSYDAFYPERAKID